MRNEPRGIKKLANFIPSSLKRELCSGWRSGWDGIHTYPRSQSIDAAVDLKVGPIITLVCKYEDFRKLEKPIPCLAKHSR